VLLAAGALGAPMFCSKKSRIDFNIGH